MDSRSSVVIRVRETTRGAAGLATVAWSLVIAVCLFGVRADHSHTSFELAAAAATLLLAAYLGWHRRTGVIFVAPVISWLFGWFPLMVAEMIRDGFIKGLFVGLFLVTFGWIIIGAAEFFALLAIAWPFRIASGLVHHDATITIESPFKVN
jgi:hypothetical protein